jgi:hypothetical protein
MGQLRRASSLSQPHSVLVTALRELHLRQGRPSMRQLERETCVSHDTVHRMLTGAALPGWASVELVVEALEGRTEEFKVLWIAARRSLDSDID